MGIEPKLFQLGQETYVELTDVSGTAQGTESTFEATEAERERIEEAVDSCPTRAIRRQRESGVLLAGIQRGRSARAESETRLESMKMLFVPGS